MPADERPLRADARRNREVILRAAAEAFAEQGLAVPLDVIAARAGVGAGTVYRHFPTKEALFEAVVAERVLALAAAARAASASEDPGAAFFGFLARLGAEGTAKRDLPDAIAVPGPVRDRLHEALSLLLERAQEAGAVRDGVTVADLVALLKGLFAALHGDGDPGRHERLLAVVADGLRSRPGSGSGADR